MLVKKNRSTCVKNWLRAEKELNYRIKQEANNLINKGYNWQISVEKAKNIVKSEIEFRAYLIYCATKDNTLDNWLKAESEFYKRADMCSNCEEYAQKLLQKTNNQFDQNAASVRTKAEFIRVKAYFIWKNKCNMEFEWYDSEKYFVNRIIEKSKKILNNQRYLSQEEAIYCSYDQCYKEIKLIAEVKRKWVSERAYYISLQYPNYSEEHNWYRAVQEFDAENSRK